MAGENTQEKVKYNPELSLTTNPTRDWEIDVRGLISTKKWLQTYGLKRNRLDLHHLMPKLGFKHCDEYDTSLKKPICSRYGEKLFPKVYRADGKSFNVACSKDQLTHLESRLSQAVSLYKRRLEWLTSESRRIFGVLEERSVVLVLDIRNMSPQQWDQYRTALERVLREQISQVAKFNIVRACEELTSYSDACVPVSQDSIDGAIEWVWNMDRLAPVSRTATCEALVKALADTNAEAVYLFTEGSACDGSREILREKLTGALLPVHVVSYNCNDSSAIDFLKELAALTGGRFHAYAVVMEMDVYEGLPVDEATNQANIILKRKTYGGVPPGAGMREDVIRLFEELEEARSNLAQVQGLIEDYSEARSMFGRESKDIKETRPATGKGRKESSRSAEDEDREETYMSSREWIDKHGLKTKKLGFYDILSGVAFKHQDGVVDLKIAPCEEYQTDALTQQKLVNARYCDKFPHVRWKNGTVMHVQVTPDIHRNYSARMTLALEAMQQRIDWLQQGSRELFGTVIEDQIYFLIDTSASMQPHIQFVKDKLFVLMQEQLRHKQKFNFVAYDSKAFPWRDRQVEVNEKNLHEAWGWVKELSCKGSTNTLGALRHALSDPNTQAIYLLSDGRPDQPPKSILAQVQLHPKVPIHTISFNCADRDANEFLCQLAKDSGGRFHYYSESGVDLDGPEPWESEDIRMLRQEIELGNKNLEKVAQLRDECAALGWSKDDSNNGRCSRDHILSMRADRDSAVPPLNSRDLYRPDSSARRSLLIDRPSSAPGYRQYTPRPPSGATNRVQSARLSSARASGGGLSRGSGGGLYSARSFSPSKSSSAFHPRPLSALSRPGTASHTRTSLLRTLSSAGAFGQPSWIMPETKELLDKQWARQQNILNASRESQKKKGKKGKTLQSSKKWLSKHGLAAKKLTILDALAPTFIPHRGTYVPILNKQVMSKVFDDILPIAHTTKGSKKNMKIVNPQGVDLDAYQKKVEAAREIYVTRLNKIVWQALPADEKENFSSDEPISYQENRVALEEALNRCGWPVSERDIQLLEKEIKQASSYIRQAKELQHAAKDGGKGLKDEDKEGDESEADKDNDKDEDDKGSVSSKASSRHFEGLGEVIEKKVGKKEKTSSVTQQRVSRTLDTLRGQRVISKSEVDGFYYPGQVLKCPNIRTAIIDFDEIGQQTVPAKFVIPVTGAIARPRIMMGDYVLARVINQDTGLECYVPGIVETIPKRSTDQAKFFTILMYTGQKAHFLISHLVKISKMRYSFLVRYIADVAHKKEKKEEDIISRSSRSRSRSASRSRSRSNSGSRSQASSRSKSHSGSRSRSRSGSRSPSRSRSRSPKYSKKTLERDQQKKLKKWQKKLKKQQTEQENRQKQLKKQAKKLAKLRRQIEQSQGEEGDNKQLLEMILTEIANKGQRTSRESARKPTSGSGSQERTEQWVNGHPPPTSVQIQAGQDGLLLTAGDVGLNISTGEGAPPFLLELRHALPSLPEGEEVLARWSDEGWYYKGIIRQDCSDGSYLVEDSIGDLERIWRENIIADNDDADTILQPKDAIIGLHPNYAFSYAPAVILDICSDLSMNVRFYDGVEDSIPRSEAYKIPAEKFELDVQNILQGEEELVGEAVVARNDVTGAYQLGVVQERVPDSRLYRIEWADGSNAQQSVTFIFGPNTKRHLLSIGDKVLAIADHAELVYLPGKITDANGEQLKVKFCDGSVSSHVDPKQCFWLSADYYRSAVTYYDSRDY